MLQYIAEENQRYSLPELAQMAIEGGCKWIVLRVPDMADEDVREVCGELVPLCKETATLLTIENRTELAKELALHGVFLTIDGPDARSVRELFGPEAIIGVQVDVASKALALAGLDVDYVAFPASMPAERVGENVEVLRASKFELPIVAECNDMADALACVALGANGVAVSSLISDAEDPVARTAEIIEQLK